MAKVKGTKDSGSATYDTGTLISEYWDAEV
jgi:hypothetical protein